MRRSKQQNKQSFRTGAVQQGPAYGAISPPITVFIVRSGQFRLCSAELWHCLPRRFLSTFRINCSENSVISCLGNHKLVGGLSEHSCRVEDRLCGLVVRIPGRRAGGPGFDSGRFQIFWVALGLERGPLISCEDKWEATWKKSSGSGLENWDHATPLYPQKLALNVAQSL
jgi:hypothetical protein